MNDAPCNPYEFLHRHPGTEARISKVLPGMIAGHVVVDEADWHEARKIREEQAKPCEWKEDDDGNWSASCGLEWVLEADTPKENGMRFCPSCGHALIETRYVEPPDEEEEVKP